MTKLIEKELSVYFGKYPLVFMHLIFPYSTLDIFFTSFILSRRKNIKPLNICTKIVPLTSYRLVKHIEKTRAKKILKEVSHTFLGAFHL